MDHTDLPKSMFAEHLLVPVLCSLLSLSLDKHVERLQSRIRCQVVQHGLCYKDCISYKPNSRELIKKLPQKREMIVDVGTELENLFLHQPADFVVPFTVRYLNMNQTL